MQLSRLVNFYKNLDDPTRIRIIALLRHGSLHGQAIAGKLGLKPPTIILRRELVMNHFMYRENNKYELNPPELWIIN
ncbi:hypothetical protein BV455_03993 [Parageobacillus caldoxylosilyticus]|nr:winged helix-turn-helix domain-containing protein [Parageobacillus caldoxylosilyticus]QXJ36781.1 hypothetical protein BV455_00040 [Parageobacillus caldoxylosilyticus]QXJ40619.1 hypothetical protein BV455_03993 [Parageobacillus caldoxylosilyticus]